ncbi:DUF3791 domain-containing protein [Bifidobacterium cuniculi]|uniref:DUF3791 domain-containing protein n=1 Tax=Bifidobacterium cuniculi TaxID=1688 RepID=A0A087B3T7_9BIFI|nr:DUF3791 domain-containing protein [Bifidobacterium cuniculi]KFI65687.1 hypothetical protein BCUN_0182 [Bifidobacterium cuniculi]
MSRQMEFFIYLLEHYAQDKAMSAPQVLASWERQGLVGEIMDSYEMYHSESLENAYADIDSLMATGRHAW